uniref:Uncharacterized protein n=1 Tax=Mycena chlorophos TaxID=658473 RepID=A0ABQ0LJG5_MYCCL|nr:predicted protein [Mycena chlorophos]
MSASSLWAILSGCASKALSLASTVAPSTPQSPPTTTVVEAKLEAAAVQTKPIETKMVVSSQLAPSSAVLPYPFLPMLHNRPFPSSPLGIRLLNVCTLLLPGDVVPRGTVVKAVTVQENVSTLEIFQDDKTLLRKTDSSKTSTTATFVVPDNTPLASLLGIGMLPPNENARVPSASGKRDEDASDDTPPLLVQLEINVDRGTGSEHTKRDGPSSAKTAGTYEHKEPNAAARNSPPVSRTPSPPVPSAAQWVARAWRWVGRR